ncbi:hypothetical protein [Caballeronia sp. LZ043]|nr:hypothetical protein [Caballeronia sp. LZ043]MDR5823415.1 hypothetical protein [Caballeronia sp. LZ043]
MAPALIAIIPIDTMLPTPSGSVDRYSIGSSTKPTCGCGSGKTTPAGV